MFVKDILAQKGTAVHSTSTDTSLQNMAQKLTEHRIGVLVCTDVSGGLIGIVSERDLAKAIARYGVDALNMSVGDVMVRDVFACGLNDRIDHLLDVMTQARCRHLPVIHEGRLVGLVSIGDLVKHRVLGGIDD